MNRPTEEVHLGADPEFDQLLTESVAAPFSGWDFSWLEGRRLEEEESRWNYEERARKLIQRVASLVDLGTGGGERLSQLGPFPPLAVATEAYGPNVPVATGRLQPLGVTVVQTHPGIHDSRGPQPDGRFSERRLPFPDAHFELVLAHSSAFCPAEVFRVLRPGGILLTAQGAPALSPTLADALQGGRSPFRYRFFSAVRQQCALVLAPGASARVCAPVDAGQRPMAACLRAVMI